MGRRRPPSIETRSFGRLERVVTALVEAGMQDATSAPPNLVERLRNLERGVASAGGDRQILQVLASGRRLMGDELELTSTDGPGDLDVDVER